MEDALKNAYYQEQIVEAGKSKGAGYTIAWILAAIFILAILFWVFNKSNAKHDECNYREADHNCVTRERIGMLEGEMKSVGVVLSQLVPNVNELGKVATGTAVGLNNWTACANEKFMGINTDIYRLDDAVYVSRCSSGHRGGCGCGNGGNRRIDQRSVYEPKSTEVIVSETCQN